MSILKTLSTSPKQAMDFVNLLPGYVWWKLYDEAHSIELMNTAAATVCGFSDPHVCLEEQITDSNLPCRASEFSEQLIVEDNKALEEPESLRLVNVICFADNDWRVTYGHKKVVRDHAGEPVGVIGHLHNLTDCTFLSNAFNLLHRDLRYDENLSQASYHIVNQYKASSLTPRESECAFYVLRGQSNREISEKLHISIKTVEVHYQHIKSKLDCRFRSQVIEKLLNLECLQQIPASLL